ncbi:tetrathionate reductase family octaheme c-type cytochrome [Magnetococcus sp. PR-3]|uniref:tetrathionate reductase family octaheme c-type cytochrome n=1 Tax=Magnetococcus sp. PR-3 TaxID=3120355 RepID=UPI002FCE3726
MSLRSQHAPSTADHTTFKVLEGPFKVGPDVTKACLTCHSKASHQLMKTTHWTWAFENELTGQTLGKKHVVNNFCVATATNWPRCTSCHIGYGWKNANFDLGNQNLVDCLVCHDTTGTYKKFPTGAGHPTYTPKVFPPKSKKIWQPVDLVKVAKGVGNPKRSNCGACHFYGGGGNGVKHGDLDSSMSNPQKALDVHMGTDGLNFTCQTCHTTGGHKVTGSRYQMNAVDKVGIDVPGKTDFTRASCESCHGMTPHPQNNHPKLNDHTDKVACQTCHVPTYARGGRKTKMWWDWSTAGKGKKVKKDADGYAVYHPKKGDFIWQANVVPEYYWFDGQITYQMLEEKIDPSGVVDINTFGGGPDHADSRIWPFKVMRGKQPYDAEQNILAVPHLFGKDKSAYWKSYDWDKAIEVGLKARGITYSGKHDWVETQYFWPITHMVAPKEQAVECNACHTKEGRLEALSGFYMPGRDSFPWLSKLGWYGALVALIGVTLHGLVRIISSSRKG